MPIENFEDWPCTKLRVEQESGRGGVIYSSEREQVSGMQCARRRDECYARLATCKQDLEMGELLEADTTTCIRGPRIGSMAWSA